MSGILVEFGTGIFQTIKRTLQRHVSDTLNPSSWRTLLIRFLGIWILFNVVKVHIADIWYGLNFRQPWTTADFPPLCSDSNIKLLPWTASDDPLLNSPGSNIRLLHIHPSNQLWGIETTLNCTSFLETPRYRALSYTWGDSDRRKPITVNGKKMMVTEDLWKALFHIRDRQHTQTLWVDAICVNHDDNEEKSIQVQLASFI
jgi:hypothetical protein